MDNKKLCFIVDNQELYLDQILVEVNEDPIFYICKSDHQYYVVLSASEDAEEYVVINSKISDILLMLTGEIAMRSLYSKVNHFWYIQVGDNISDDNIIKKDISELDSCILPYENEKFVICTPEIKEYVSDLEKALTNNKYFIEDETFKFTINVSLTPTLNKIMTDFSDYLQKISESIMSNFDFVSDKSLYNVNYVVINNESANTMIYDSTNAA